MLDRRRLILATLTGGLIPAARAAAQPGPGPYQGGPPRGERHPRDERPMAPYTGDHPPPPRMSGAPEAHRPPPPPLRHEDRPPPPRGRYHWQWEPGRWVWNGVNWVWNPGRWYR